VKVAVVYSALPAEGGGVFTFEDAMRRGLVQLAGSSRHEFVTYALGSGAPPDGETITIPQTRRNRYERLARRQVVGLQDRWDTPRLSWRTWFQRSLDEQGVDFVWFASHFFEECEQPYMATVWDLAHIEYPWFPEVGAGGEWERRQAYFERYLGRAARVIVPNVALEDLLVKAFPMPRARLLQIPFATPEWALAPHPHDDAEVLERHGIRAPYLFYPAQFWAHKNHVTALKVLKLLNAERDEPFQLVLVGSDKGTLEHVRATAAEMGVVSQVRFLGFVEQEDLVSLYRGAHALLYLSFFGPSNLPPLEACALGCPVVCADMPGMRLQLGEAALYGPPTDVETLAEGVKATGEPSERARLVAAGKALADGLTPAGYVARVIEELDAFEPIRRTWGN
jgi:glycosyltransferase involved in cell wall biosynthesis